MPRTRPIVLGLAGLIWLGGHAHCPAAAPPTDAYQRLLREASLALLKDGNQHFLQNQSQRPNQDSERRAHTAKEGQEPFATVLTCSDSRVPPELIFDRGLGDLFVIRVAGNIAGDSELTSIEYGVGHLSTPLLLVLGHSGCGAVSAVASGAELEGHLHDLVGRIEPAVAQVRAQNVATNEFIPRAIEANVWHTIEEIFHHSELVRASVTNQKLQVLGAVYDLTSGTVQWLGPHPDQEALLQAPESSPVAATTTPSSPAEPIVEPPREPRAAPPTSTARRRPIPSPYLVPARGDTTSR